MLLLLWFELELVTIDNTDLTLGTEKWEVKEDKDEGDVEFEDEFELELEEESKEEDRSVLLIGGPRGWTEFGNDWIILFWNTSIYKKKKKKFSFN